MAALPRWLGVRLQHLVALETVVQTGSFMRAASALGYSQSAVSQQIAALENVVGGRLLERGESLSPTIAGEIVLRRARAIHREFSSLHAELDALESGRSEARRIVTHHPAATWFLPEVLDRFRKRSQRCSLVARVAPSLAAVVHALEGGTAELAFAVMPPAADEELVVEPLLEVPIGVVVSSSSPQAAGTQLSSNDLAGLRFLCLNDCPATDRLLRDLVERGIPHEVVVRADDEATLVKLVRAGAGAALLPGLPGVAQETDLVRRELAERYAVVVSVAWCVHRAPAEDTLELLELARRVARRRSWDD